MLDKTSTSKNIYSKIPILRPPLGLPKVVLKTTFWRVPKGGLYSEVHWVYKMKKIIT